MCVVCVCVCEREREREGGGGSEQCEMQFNKTRVLSQD